VRLVDLLAEGLGIELDGAVLFVDELVELARLSIQKPPAETIIRTEESTHLGPKHPQDLAALIVDNGLRLDVVQHGHGEPPLVLGVHREINVAKVGEGLVARQGVRDDVLPRGISVLGRGEAPAYFASPTHKKSTLLPQRQTLHAKSARPTLGAHMPMHHREGNHILQALELPRDERAVGLNQHMMSTAKRPVAQDGERR
jgi:hypothetical protein